jgi:hypothetical protein
MYFYNGGITMKVLKYIVFIAEYFMIGFLYLGLDLSEKTRLYIWIIYALFMGIKATIILEDK